jgi:dephospho-CoA kinase
MATYVVAIRREARSCTVTAQEWVRQVPGVQVKGAGNPSRVVIEASSQAVSEIERRFGYKVIVEPEIRHERLGE